MDMGGAALRVLQGSAAFTGLVAILITFLAFLGYVSNGMSGARRSSGISILVVLVVGAIAVAAFLFPNLTNDVIAEFNRISSR